MSKSVGLNVSYAELRAAFHADTSGAQVNLGCDDGCRFSQVWLGYEAVPATLAPLVSPKHAVNLSSAGTCAQCETVHIPAWTGCPPPPEETPVLEETLSRDIYRVAQ